MTDPLLKRLIPRRKRPRTFDEHVLDKVIELGLSVAENQLHRALDEWANSIARRTGARPPRAAVTREHRTRVKDPLAAEKAKLDR